MSQQRAKKIKEDNYTEMKIEGILERGKRLVEKINSNLYPEYNYEDYNPHQANSPSNILQYNNNDKRELDMLERAELLEYSTELHNEKAKKNEISFSNLNDSLSNHADAEKGNINIKDYENIVMKIDNITITDEKSIKTLKENLIYLECKVPLFKAERKNAPDVNNIFYDTFKIYNKTNTAESNVFNLDHVSYHKIKLGEDNFAALTNSKIEFYLHCINLRKNNEDTIIGKGLIDFNRLLLAKDFFLNINLEITNYIEKPKEEEETKDSKTSKNTQIKRPASKKPMGRQNQQAKQIDNKKLIQEIPYKIGDLKVSCQLYRNTNASHTEQLNKENFFNNNFANDFNQNENRSNINANDFFPEEGTHSKINNEAVNKNASANNVNSQISNIHQQQGENTKNAHNFEELNYDELKLDFDDILVLYVKVSHLVPFTNDNQNNKQTGYLSRNAASMNNNYYNNSNEYFNNNQNNNVNNQNMTNYRIYNFYLSHKIFPKSEISNSEIYWNSVAPRFDYELSMPFVVNQQTAEMLDKSAFILELWNKASSEDELLGTCKLDLFPIIDSLRINEDTLSIIPISRNLQPLIIYDGNYPVFNYDLFNNIYYLDLTLAVGTTAQINNYIKKNKATNQARFMQQSQYNSAYSGDAASRNNMNLNYANNESLKNPGSIMDYNMINMNNNNFRNNYNQQPNFVGVNNRDNLNNNFNKNTNDINQDEIFEINNLMNNNKALTSDEGGISNTNFAKFDVEKFLENNRLELDQINSKEGWSSDINNNKNNKIDNIYSNKNAKEYSNPFLTNNDKKPNQYENPFIVNTNQNTNPNNNTNLNLSELPPNFKNLENKEKNYHISKESNFNIDNNTKENTHGYNNRENAYKLNKLSDTEFFKSGGKNLLKSIENNDINPEFDNFHQFKIEGGIFNDISKTNDNRSSNEKDNVNKNRDVNEIQLNTDSKADNTVVDNPIGLDSKKNFIPRFNSKAEEKLNSKENQNQIKNINNFNDNYFNDQIDNNNNSVISGLNPSNLVRHTFEIIIEKLINLQILHKLTKNRPFLRYRFFNDSAYVKSDILYYSEYDKETSTIIVDMKTSHSNVIKSNDKIKDLLADLQIQLIYLNENSKEENESNEIVFGKANLPVEDFQELIFNSNKNNNSNKKCTIFIYGTEKINREDCIIGKLKMSINYCKQNVQQENENENILYEKQVVYSRKIPKNSCLIFKLNYFKYNENFLKNYDCHQHNNNNYFYFEIDIFHDDKNLRNVFKTKKSSKKFKSLNGLFEEEFLFEMEMTPAILEYMKSKKALINLIVAKNTAGGGFFDMQNNIENKEKNSSDVNKSNIKELNLFDSDEDDLNIEKEILGSCRFSLNEILTDPDFSNKVYDVLANNSSKANLGYVNFDIKLENSASVEGRVGKSTKEKANQIKNKEALLKNIDHLRTIMKTKKDRHLDGKFYFILNISKLVFDENFVEKNIDSYVKNNLSNKNKITLMQGKNTFLSTLDKFTSKPTCMKNYFPAIEFYLTFKLGKNIKRITPLNNFNESERVFKNSNFMLNEINFTEVLELNLQFSKNKPEDIVRAFTDNLFEIKMYLKSEDDNDINIGSFILDISKLLSSESKINDKIYFSKNANVNLFENSNVLLDGVKLATNFSLIKSEYEKSDFLSFYESMKNIFLNNFSIIQSNLMWNDYIKSEINTDEALSDYDYERPKSPNKYFSDDSAKNEILGNKKLYRNNQLLKQKKFKKLFKRLLGKDLFEYIDLHLINLENDDGNLNYKNIKELSKLFTNGILITNQICKQENLILIENIKNYSKLKLKKKLINDRNKYIFDIFELSKILKIKIPNSDNDTNLNDYNIKGHHENFNHNKNNQGDIENTLIQQKKKKSSADFKYISKFSNFDMLNRKIKLPAEDTMLFLKNFKRYLNDGVTNSFAITENPAYEKANTDIIDLLDFIIEIYRLEKTLNTPMLHSNNNNNDENNPLPLDAENVSTSELNTEIDNNNKINYEKNKDLITIEEKNFVEEDKKDLINYSTVKFNVVSGTNLIILDKPLSFKPNSYFVFNWGSEETYTSNAIIHTSNPDWLQEIEVKIPLNKINSNKANEESFLADKLTKNVSITVFSKQIPNEELQKLMVESNQNTNICYLNNVSSQEFLSDKNIINPFATVNNLNPSLMHRDEFIGETNISLFDILLNLLEERNCHYNNYSNTFDFTHDGFYHIYNRKDNIVGQIHFKVCFEENLILAFKEILSSQNNIDYNLNYKPSKIAIVNKKFTSAASGFDYSKSGNLVGNFDSNIKINTVYDINNKNSLNNFLPYSENKMINSDFNKKNNDNNNNDYNYESFNRNKLFNKQINLEELDNELLWKKIKENEEFLNKIHQEESLTKLENKNHRHESNKKDNPLKKEENIKPEYSAMGFNSANKDLNNDENLANKSLQMNFEEEIKEKNYEFHSLIEKLDKEHEKIENDINEKINHSMIEKPKLNLKKPPVPEFNNLYKKADKNFLKKIQNILKKNESKSFNYLSSEEEN